ncbi:MAG: SAM-dependent methyltransferase [Gemmatimonadales bacterium]
MIPSRPSKTAAHVAMRRAAHQLIDTPLVLEDPLALRIIGPELRARLDGSLETYDRTISVRRRRAFLVARARFADEQLAAALSRGVRQFVVLGAGLDTAVYRVGPQEPPLTLFEVDHPATQAWKRERLAVAQIDLPAGLTFAPIDFTEQTLAEGLTAAGFDFSRPTFVSWLGVTMYLTEAVALETLRVLAALPSGSEVVFDYVEPRWSWNPLFWIMRRRQLARLAKMGEPWLSAFKPGPLADKLRAFGYRDVDDLNGKALNARYFSNRADDLRVGAHGHVVAALK